MGVGVHSGEDPTNPSRRFFVILTWIFIPLQNFSGNLGIGCIWPVVLVSHNSSKFCLFYMPDIGCRIILFLRSNFTTEDPNFRTDGSLFLWSPASNTQYSLNRMASSTLSLPFTISFILGRTKQMLFNITAVSPLPTQMWQVISSNKI